MELEASYQKTLEYLYSFVDYSLTRMTRNTAESFDLGRMRRLMQALGDPQQAYPSIHIAGTKGKGSVAALCAAALQSAGYRVGLYTSPHLWDFCERIQVDGQPIPHADLIALVDELRPQIEAQAGLTTFEISTALAFIYFARRGATAAVIEVGLGGRLDATNVIQPTVSVITSLSLDHTAILGDTLAEIAAEKGGIIKSGSPLVCAAQKHEARAVLERIATERGVPLTQTGRDVHFTGLEHNLDGQTLMVWKADEQARMDAYLEGAGDWQPRLLRIPLLGYHQVENAALAWTALDTARQSGLAITDEDIRAGFALAHWPGRFEVLRRTPPVVVDSAHNRDSALRLRQALDDYFPGMPVTLVFGASEDKDIEGMLAELAPRVQLVIATRSIHPRAIQPEQLVEMVHQAGRPCRVAATVEEALDRALESAEQNNGLALAAGSIFIAAGARQAWLETHARRRQV
jgi:dihydrofolate synthase/folylpolyglutamate synthase